MAVRKPLHSLSTALRFLTIFPAFGSSEDDQSFFGGALYYFSVVGIIIGCLAALSAFILGYIGSPFASAVLLTVLLSAVSGFLHLDGLADSADGFLSSRDRKHSLEIMKDSRIGVMGAAAICSILLLKSAAIFSIDQLELKSTLVVTAVAGRTAMVMVMAFLPYARPEGELGQLFYRQASHFSVPLISALVLLATIIFLLPGKLLISILVFILLLILFSFWSYKKIGGFTGDTLGCIGEIMETGFLIGISCNF